MVSQVGGSGILDFDRPLEQVLLLQAGPHGLAPVPLPEAGQSVRLPRATPAFQMTTPR